jgi:hypothetical protein
MERKSLLLISLMPLGIILAFLADLIKNGARDCRDTDVLDLSVPCAELETLLVSDTLFFGAIASFILIIILPMLLAWRKYQSEKAKLSFIKIIE